MSGALDNQSYQSHIYIMMKLVPSYDTVLHTPAAPVEDSQIQDLAATIQQMREVMQQNGGIGLAAPQVGVPLSMFLMRWMQEDRVCINPQIAETSSETDEMEEGCLSFPHLRLPVKRPLWIQALWTDETGRSHCRKLHGLEARVFLHEWDHCQGICFTDRVGKTTLMLAKKRAAKTARSRS